MSGLSPEENKFVKGVNIVRICPKDSFGDLSNPLFVRDKSRPYGIAFSSVFRERIHFARIAHYR
jgi:hypothetical protein